MVMLRSAAPLKRLAVMKELQERIQSGLYGYGERLPSVQELTAELHASYVTVNRAIKLLEEAGYVECRHGVGNFICCRAGNKRPSTKVVNLICPAPMVERREETIMRFWEEGCTLFAASQWEVRRNAVAGDFSGARPLITDPEAYSVVFGFRPYWKNFSASLEHVRNRVVLIGERSDLDGIACITSDETQTIRLALAHLRETGRRRVALVCANLHSQLEMLRAAAWRSLQLEAGFTLEWCRRFCLDMMLPDMAPTEEFVRRQFAKLAADGRLKQMDALIAPDDDVAAQWIGILLDHGYRVPEDFAVISIGNTALARLFRPQITSIDSNIESHLTTALAILESRMAGYPECGLFHLCQPRLMVRASTAAGTPSGEESVMKLKSVIES